VNPVLVDTHVVEGCLLADHKILHPHHVPLYQLALLNRGYSIDPEEWPVSPAFVDTKVVEGCLLADHKTLQPYQVPLYRLAFLNRGYSIDPDEWPVSPALVDTKAALRAAFGPAYFHFGLGCVHFGSLMRRILPLDSLHKTLDHHIPLHRRQVAETHHILPYGALIHWSSDGEVGFARDCRRAYHVANYLDHCSKHCG